MNTPGTVSRMTSPYACSRTLHAARRGVFRKWTVALASSGTLGSTVMPTPAARAVACRTAARGAETMETVTVGSAAAAGCGAPAAAAARKTASARITVFLICRPSLSDWVAG
jgi:hypothetical protein